MKLEKLPDIDTAYACQADRVFKDEMFFSWQKHQIRLIEIPGHSPGGIGIYLDNDAFFSGDRLIKDCEVELRFPGGSRKQWLELGEPQIKAVPKGTRIYPGHFESFILE
jgi:glyoxylase-like metal-dependent hydrolase (beta-lactamase superfamily II)